MTLTRRNLLAGAGAAAASTLLARAAGAQSFPFSPNQRYPDPAVQILDPSFAKYRIYSSTRRTGRHRHALGRRAGVFPRRRLFAVLRHPQQPHHEVRREDQPDQRVPRQRQLCQRQRPRPPGPARHLRAFGHPPHHAHREGRQDHGAGRQVRGQAAERAERHRGQVRRHASGSPIRCSASMASGKARRKSPSRPPPTSIASPRTASSPPSSPTSSIPTGSRSRRTRRSSMSWSGRARPTAASGVMTSTPTARWAARPS